LRHSISRTYFGIVIALRQHLLVRLVAMGRLWSLNFIRGLRGTHCTARSVATLRYILGAFVTVVCSTTFQRFLVVPTARPLVILSRFIRDEGGLHCASAWAFLSLDIISRLSHWSLFKTRHLLLANWWSRLFKQLNRLKSRLAHWLHLMMTTRH